MYPKGYMLAIEVMVHARKVALLQDIRLEYGFRQYLKSYCYDCIQDIHTAYTKMIDYKEYTFCSQRCASKRKRARCKRQKRSTNMDDLCKLYNK